MLLIFVPLRWPSSPCDRTVPLPQANQMLHATLEQFLLYFAAGQQTVVATADPFSNHPSDPSNAPSHTYTFFYI